MRTPSPYQRIGNDFTGHLRRMQTLELFAQQAVQQRPVAARVDGVDADVGVRLAVDQTRERPGVAAQPFGHRGEDELVALAVKAAPVDPGDRHVAHHRLADAVAADLHQLPAHQASRAVGADDDARVVAAALGLDAHAPWRRARSAITFSFSRTSMPRCLQASTSR